MNRTHTPSFKGLRPSSNASSHAKSSNRSGGLKSEILLRRSLHHSGLRFRINVKSIKGKPDIVFTRTRVAIFCDGDFWHGRNWRLLRRKLLNGWNGEYWTTKVKSNIERDKQINSYLRKHGWKVMRYWETDILSDVNSIVEQIKKALCFEIDKK